MMHINFDKFRIYEIILYSFFLLISKDAGIGVAIFNLQNSLAVLFLYYKKAKAIQANSAFYQKPLKNNGKIPPQSNFAKSL